MIGANAFFVIGEYAIVMAHRSPLRERADAGSKGARTALRLMDDPVRVISTVQVGVTGVSILVGALGEPVVRALLGERLPVWARFMIAFGIVAYLSVVLGELVPKALTLDRADRLAVRVARPVELMAKMLHPVVSLLQGSAALLLRPLGVEEVSAGTTIRTPEELRALVDEAEGLGVIGRAQEELLHNVFDFATREARDVMIPAPDVAWLDVSCMPDEALGRVIDVPHERYPVGEGSLDRLRGIVHLRDLIAASRSREPVTVGALARPALIVPPTKQLGALLRMLRDQRQQLAVVIDEYGDAEGIVSMHDVLEEIVGEIENEYDLPNEEVTWVDEHTVEAPGSMTIDDFNEEVGTELPQRGPRTLAGLTLDALGRLPEPGDEVELGGVRIRVEALDGLRITRLRIAR